VARRCSSVRGLLALLLAALTLAACSAADDSGVEGPVTVYVSLPLTGPFGGDGRDAADGARLALEQARGRAGDLEVRARYLDDARGKPWDPVAVGANARAAAQDSSTAAYIGELSSQPTRASLPITNDAGIAQVSPGAGAIDLTEPAKGYPDSPDRYRPSGEQTFARVVPSDEELAAGAAQLLSELGVSRAFVGADERDAWGALLTQRFREAAEADGVEPLAPSPGPLGGGEARVLFPAPVPPAEGGPAPVVLVGTEDREYALSAAQDPQVLPQPRGAGFAETFLNRFGRSPGAFAAYGHQAMATVLRAIAERDEADDGFRAGVASALLEFRGPDSLLGSFVFTEAGDSTLCRIQADESPGAGPSALCVRP